MEQTQEGIAPAALRLVNSVVDDAQYDAIVREVHKQRMAAGKRTLSKHELLDIVAAQAYVRHEAFVSARKSKIRKPVRFADVTARILRRKKQLCAETWKEFRTTNDVTAAPDDSQRGIKRTKFKRSKKLAQDLREWLYARNIKRQRTVARDVLDFFVRELIIPEDEVQSSKGRASCLRSVQRYLNWLGYVRGERSGQKTYREREEILARRDSYVIDMLALTKTKRIVYLDESYVHHHYQSHQNTLHDPQDDRPLPKNKHKGLRMCFIAAIVSGDPTLKDDPCEFMKDTSHAFQGSKQTGDYHGMFNAQYFQNWMKTLLECLAKRGYNDCVIIMDNAKYHVAKPASAPVYKWKKAELKVACEQQGILVGPKDTKDIIWSKLQDYRKNMLSVVEQMAQDAGHTVKFSPPHYSDLQPIELVWAVIKQRIGAQYTTDTTFAQVKERLQTAFDSMSPATVAGCIAKACNNLKHLHKLIIAQENAEEGIEIEESDSDDDENAAAAEVQLGDYNIDDAEGDVTDSDFDSELDLDDCDDNSDDE
jgi:transposase